MREAHVSTPHTPSFARLRRANPRLRETCRGAPCGRSLGHTIPQMASVWPGSEHQTRSDLTARGDVINFDDVSALKEQFTPAAFTTLLQRKVLTACGRLARAKRPAGVGRAVVQRQRAAQPTRRPQGLPLTLIRVNHTSYQHGAVERKVLAC